MNPAQLILSNPQMMQHILGNLSTQESVRDYRPETKKDSGYPPINVYTVDETMVIEMAVAGFSREELVPTFDGSVLTVSGRKVPAEETDSERYYIQRNIGFRSFERVFEFKETMEVVSARLKDGLFTFVLKKVQKPLIEIMVE